MKQSGGFWGHLDKGILLALILGGVAAWPLFTYAGLPNATDAELHVFRIAEMGYSLRAGNPYPRWAPDFYHGYGYPIFNYYAPLIYHLGYWLALFNPVKAAVGAKLLCILAYLLGATGAYLLGREFGGKGGGLLGAAAFVFTPYIMLFDPLVRGDLAEVFALALIPWTLWSWERLWQGGGKAVFVLAVLSASATLLSHNLTGLTTIVILGALSLWHWLALKQRSQVKYALLAGGLVAMLTAYFWVPFLLEQRLVQLDVAGEGYYDFRNHFVLLSELLAVLPPQDWRATTIQAPMSAGPLQLLLAVMGSIAAARHRRFRRVLFYLLSGGFCFWLVTAQSKSVWESLPGFAYYQFPWRFLGPLAALIVPPIASLGAMKGSARIRAGLLVGLIGGVVVLALPALDPVPWESDLTDITPVRILSAELQGRWRGTTSTNDFVPVTVDTIPGPQESVLASYRHPPVDRVNRYTLPEGATVEVLGDVPWHNRFQVQTPQKFILRLYLFYFPGWKAYIDGAEVPIEIAHPEGFVTVLVPAGEHEVLASFEDTIPRQIGWGVAAVGIVTLGLSIWRFPKVEPSDSTQPSDKLALSWIVLGLALLVLFKVGIADSLDWYQYTSPPGEALAAHYRQKAHFDEDIAALGYDLSSDHPKPGGVLEVTIYWNALRPMTETYQSFVHLVYPEGQIWAQSDHLNPAGFPTNLWPTDRYVRDKHRLMLPPDLPPGEYYLSVGIYKLRDNTRLPVTWAESGIRPDYLILDQKVTIRR